MRTDFSHQRPRLQRGGSISISAVLLLALLLVIPICALSRVSAWVDWRLLAAAALAISLITYSKFRSDKRRAEEGEWRIPESNLHLAELMGGWPGAFLAQRKFRHKIAKRSYQIEFWIIVSVHQLAAFDFLLDWKLTKEAVNFIQTQSANWK